MSSWCEIILIRCWIGIRGDHLRNKIIWKFFLKFWKIQWKIKTFTNLLRQTSFVAKTFAKLADFTGHRANQCFERVSCEVSSLLYQPKIWAKDSQKSFLLNADGNKKIFWIGWLPKTSVKILEMERNGKKLNFKFSRHEWCWTWMQLHSGQMVKSKQNISWNSIAPEKLLSIENT